MCFNTFLCVWLGMCVCACVCVRARTRSRRHWTAQRVCAEGAACWHLGDAGEISARQWLWHREGLDTRGTGAPGFLHGIAAMHRWHQGASYSTMRRTAARAEEVTTLAARGSVLDYLRDRRLLEICNFKRDRSCSNQRRTSREIAHVLLL